jgi:hypothetical protein
LCLFPLTLLDSKALVKVVDAGYNY